MRASSATGILAIARARATSVVLRAIHVTTMAPLLGGVVLGAAPETLRTWTALAVASGVLLLLGDLLARRMMPTHASAAALIVKLALLAIASAVPAQRLAWYLAATFIACLASHMPRAWRHFSLTAWHVVGRAEGERR